MRSSFKDKAGIILYFYISLKKTEPNIALDFPPLTAGLNRSYKVF